MNGTLATDIKSILDAESSLCPESVGFSLFVTDAGAVEDLARRLADELVALCDRRVERIRPVGHGAAEFLASMTGAAANRRVISGVDGLEDRESSCLPGSAGSPSRCTG